MRVSSPMARTSACSCAPRRSRSRAAAELRAAARRSCRLPATHQRGGGVQHDDVAVGVRLRHRAGDERGGVVGGIAAVERGRRARGRPGRSLGIDLALAHRAVAPARRPRAGSCVGTRPSRPRRARPARASVPSRPSASAIGSTHDGRTTPTSWRVTSRRVRQRAQQVEDRALARVRAGSAPHALDRGWWSGANRKQMPTSRSAASAEAVGASRSRPSASSTSAAPDLTRRRGCRAWRPARRRRRRRSDRGRDVERAVPSPPVPQMSTAPSGARSGPCWRAWLLPAPVSSSDSFHPVTHRPISKPPT